MLNISQLLKNRTNLSEVELSYFVESMPKCYKVYLIEKRTGGSRTIAQPTKDIKIIQRIVTEYLQQYLPIHNSAFAYRKKLDIKKNAELHQDNTYILKVDLLNFFNSIKPELLQLHLKRLGLDISDTEFNMLKNILFWNPTKKRYGQHILSIGAPSSPFISNALMYYFDISISDYCSENRIVYSRYADDMTFSTKKKDIMFDLPNVIKKTLKSEFNTMLYLNDSKTVFSSKKHNRHVTGVTINNEGQISVGRKKKRYISSLVHRFTINKLNDNEILHLKGLLAHSCYIEPEIYNRLEKKYGVGTIDSIKRIVCDE
jgi:RNA-directed DNA polymerase